MRSETIVIARWVTAIALFLQAFPLARHAGGLLMPALAFAELAGCVLFVIPRLVRAGAALLLVVILVAAAIHLAHGEHPISLVYPALLVILLGGRK